jgi:hypothetical protein
MLNNDHFRWHFFEFLESTDIELRKFIPGCLVAHAPNLTLRPKVSRFGMIISINTKSKKALVLWQDDLYV